MNDDVPSKAAEAGKEVAKRIMAHPMMSWNHPVADSIEFLETIVTLCRRAIDPRGNTPDRLNAAVRAVEKLIMAHPMMSWSHPLTDSIEFLEAIVAFCQRTIQNLKDQQ